jgi:glycosyltransferase involved in cell wall biosynthesis
VKVTVMGRSLRGRFSGVVRYTDELVRALAARSDIDLTVMLTRADDGLDLVAAKQWRAPVPTPNEYARALWEQLVVPTAVARIRPDVYHSPNYILPLALRCPTVVTVHDLSFLERSLHRLRSHLYLSALTTLSMRKATRIICVSEATRQELVRRFPSLGEKARVVAEGVNGKFERSPEAAIAGFRKKHRLDRPYVLFVGTIEPRKNLVRLIKAFEIATLAGSIHDLVLIGPRGWKDAPVWAAIRESPVSERIKSIGYVDDADLAAAYSGADVFAYPSLAEGFGLPTLEAMACGTPVLTSRVSALPEVVGDAALLVDPLAIDDIAAGLRRLLCDGGERARLVTVGFERVAHFDWDHVAQKTLAVYQEAAA